MTTKDVREGLPSASKLERIVRCPGSLKLENSIPKSQAEVVDADPLADRGTRIHKAFETGNTLELDEDEVAAYKQGVKFTTMLVDQWKTDFNIIHQEELPREERTWYNHPETLEVLGSAVCDRRYIAPPYMLIIDLKSGWATHVPPSPRSLQLRLQALCEWRARTDIKHIRVAFARAMSKVGAEDYCDYAVEDLQRAENSVLQAFWEAAQEDANKQPGGWCRYCPGKSWCDVAGAHSLLPSVAAKRTLPMLSDKAEAELAVECMSMQDLAKIFEVSAQVGWIIDAVKARLKAMPAAELMLLGLELAPGKKLDPITATDQCFKFLMESGWDLERIWKCVSFSKTELVKAARQEKGLSSDDKARQWIATALAPFITQQNSEGYVRRIKG